MTTTSSRKARLSFLALMMARKWTLLTWVQNTITGSFHSVVFNSFLQLYLSFAALLTAECVCRCMCASDRSLVFAEVTMLSNHISDYPLISQGQTRIPGVNDSEELILTVVSQTAHEAAPVFRHWTLSKSDTHMLAPAMSRAYCTVWQSISPPHRSRYVQHDRDG